MKLNRRQFAAAMAAAAADPSALYRLIDRIAEKPARKDPGRPPQPEQHLLHGLDVIRDGGVEVLVPPLHHRVITARVAVEENRDAVQEARRELERVLAKLDADYPFTPSGLGVTLAWGLPYFRRFVPAQARRAIPVDLRASAACKHPVRVLEDAERFPSDPDETILEENDLAVLLRSDHLDAIDDAQRRLFNQLPGLLAVTSIRSGWIGGGFSGKPSLPKRMAMKARIPGAELMPPTAELFLGFTSTVRQTLGPPKIANFETLGWVELPDDYFVGGTHMHLSHLSQNLNAWYLNFDRHDRVGAMFRPGRRVKPTAQTIRQAPSDIETSAEIRADYARHRRVGHAGAIQSASRLTHTITGPDGTAYQRGTAVPQRADFNTLDNPFAWSAHTRRDRMSRKPHAGTHFVVFNPSGDDFRRVRLAMDGVLPDGVRLDLAPRSIGQGINAVFHATHRQNFLVPPRTHRSFPLTEITR
jgi:deferrochelatase/peroxidase EfeB